MQAQHSHKFVQVRGPQYTKVFWFGDRWPINKAVPPFAFSSPFQRKDLRILSICLLVLAAKGKIVRWYVGMDESTLLIRDNIIQKPHKRFCQNLGAYFIDDIAQGYWSEILQILWVCCFWNENNGGMVSPSTKAPPFRKFKTAAVTLEPTKSQWVR
jgi:hypothetical protein